jgi:hypothetical protein
VYVIRIYHKVFKIIYINALKVNTHTWIKFTIFNILKSTCHCFNYSSFQCNSAFVENWIFCSQSISSVESLFHNIAKVRNILQHTLFDTCKYHALPDYCRKHWSYLHMFLHVKYIWHNLDPLLLHTIFLHIFKKKSFSCLQ